jgi:hypothetical protein
VEHLTTGELQPILQRPEYWEQVGIKYDNDLKNFAAAVEQAYLALTK